MNTLLLTATISPHKDVRNLKVNNADDRFIQYVRNILGYLCFSDFDSIIFCDNSNFNISIENELLSISKKIGKNLELLKFLGNHEETVKRGRGFGENEIIEYVIKNSSLIKKTDSFYKCTGRYYCTNINKIIKSTQQYGNYFCRQMPRARNDFCFDKVHTALYKCSIEFFNQYLSGAGLDVNDYVGKNLEAVYYDRIKSNSVYNLIHHLPFYPEYEGFAGGGQNLSRGVIKATIFKILHKTGFNKL